VTSSAPEPAPEPAAEPADAPVCTVTPVTGIGEVTPATDLAAEVRARVALASGDVLVVTSKVVSKAEGRLASGDRDALLAGETDRVVARRGPTVIVRTSLGLVMAAGGIDASNVQPGTVVLLPRDPDASARRLRAALARDPGVNVGVVVSDTSGRAWRTGQTDIAVGAAGVRVLDDLSGRVDGYGNPLRVTAPALADELAGAGDLVKGKLRGCPVAVVRGLGHLVLPRDADGPGARALVRSEEEDLFGYGAREAVVRAVLAESGADEGPAGRGFGTAAEPGELRAVLDRLLAGRASVQLVEGRLEVRTSRPAATDEVRIGVLAAAHRWRVDRRERDVLVLARDDEPGAGAP
jgi:coenzyme F420-0:L-glutamate ligase/coenzyme F420-1:gamma-L-glutamate ligase